MPTIEISEANFARLQKFATPLVDSVETAFNKVLGLAEKAAGKSTNLSPAVPIQPQTPPDLTHTTLTSATINGKSLASGLCNWNALLLAVVEQAAKQLPPGVAIREIIVVNHTAGQKEDHGYKYLKNLGISIQGQNSNNAWKAIVHLAKATGVKVEANYYWGDHPKAAKPGELGHLAS